MSQDSKNILVVQTRKRAKIAEQGASTGQASGETPFVTRSKIARSPAGGHRDSGYNTTVVRQSDSSSEEEEGRNRDGEGENNLGNNPQQINPVENAEIFINPVANADNNNLGVIVEEAIVEPEVELIPEVEMAQANNNQYLVRLRDAAEVIPIFSGQSDHATFREFQLGCEDALKMLPANAEAQLVNLLRTKLRGGALETIRGEQLATVRALLNQLKPMYAPLESINILRGQLGQIYQREAEDCPTFFNRVRNLGYSIIEAKKSETNAAELTADQTAEINTEVLNAFKLGLKREISAQLAEVNDLTQAGLTAVKIENQMKMQDQLRERDRIGCVICMDKNHIAKNCTLLNNKG